MPDMLVELGDLESLPPRAKERGDRARKRTQNGDQPNFPSKDISHLIYGDQPGKKHRLWITDRIMEPQTIPHFLEFAQSGFLPNDQKTWRPLLTFEEVKNMMRSSSEWAPAPHNHQSRSTGEWIGIRIGSHEDSSRLWRISKELHAMKSRLWEGLPPLSERRWKELGLDEPQNFPAACRYFVAVNDVFTYLNNKRTKAALRTTYNLIWDHLRVFEQAVNAKRKSEAEDGVYQQVSVTALWYEYIKAQYDAICENAHHWLMEHIERIQESLVQQIAHYQPEGTEDHYDDTQWEIIWKIRDLGKNSAQADFSIFLPMDGYKGGSLPIQENDPLTRAHQVEIRKQPISWSANLNWREADYDNRFKWLFVCNLGGHHVRERFDESVRENDPANAVILNISQIDAQGTARQELRGPPRPTDVIPWIELGERNGGDERASESPGYNGTLRILGSLLWDELGAMLVMMSALPRDLWPMALDDPERIYRGPKVTPVLKFSTYEETLTWKLASEIVPDLVEIKHTLDTGENRHRQDNIDDDFYS